METKEQAAALLAEGLSIAEIAQRMQVAEAQVLTWLENPEVMKCYHRHLNGSKVVSYARAVRRIAGQMQDENPMVVLRAAKEALEKFEGAAAGGGEGGLTVRLEGIPPLGMPSLEEEDEL